MYVISGRVLLWQLCMTAHDQCGVKREEQKHQSGVVC